MNVTYFDAVDQVFVADENFHILAGVTSGESDSNGKDLLDKHVHLVIPYKKAVTIFTEISNSMAEAYEAMMIESAALNEGREDQDPRDQNESLGRSVIVKFE